MINIFYTPDAVMHMFLSNKPSLNPFIDTNQCTNRLDAKTIPQVWKHHLALWEYLLYIHSGSLEKMG